MEKDEYLKSRIRDSDSELVENASEKSEIISPKPVATPENLGLCSNGNIYRIVMGIATKLDGSAESVGEHWRPKIRQNKGINKRGPLEDIYKISKSFVHTVKWFE